MKIIKQEQYPEKLKKLKDKPKQIYVKGNIELLKNKKVAIVGSRKNTEYGQKIALNFAKELSKEGYTIVAGLAIGIDKYAHIGGILEEGNTIAVLPNGFNNIYPPENEKLYNEILENNGLAITEYEPEIKANSNQFVDRNRIIATISDAVLVVEGDYGSGAGITARIAKENDIPLFCIPSNLDNSKGYTPHQYIKNGAKIATNIQDIINVIDIEKFDNKLTRKKMEFKEDILHEYEIRFHNTINKKQNENQSQEILNKYPTYEFITEKPMYIDDLARKSNKNISEINYELTMLILEGYIKELPGKNYKLIEAQND